MSEQLERRRLAVVQALRDVAGPADEVEDDAVREPSELRLVDLERQLAEVRLQLAHFVERVSELEATRSVGGMSAAASRVLFGS